MRIFCENPLCALCVPRIIFDGINLTETILLHVDHVSDVRTSLDHNLQAESLPELRNCFLLDDMGNARSRRAFEPPPRVFAEISQPLIGIEKRAIAKCLVRNFP